MQNSTRVHSTAHVHSTSELIPPRHHAPCMQVLRTVPVSPATGRKCLPRPSDLVGLMVWNQMEPDGDTLSHSPPLSACDRPIGGMSDGQLFA